MTEINFRAVNDKYNVWVARRFSRIMKINFGSGFVSNAVATRKALRLALIDFRKECKLSENFKNFWRKNGRNVTE